MNQGYKKYKPYTALKMPSRQWPEKRIEKAPVWCSVDLRDGNQALINPMNLEQKLKFFKLLTEVGFKEIEVGFPSASETEYEILRTLIERKLIPDDVTVQVLVQARKHLIEKTFESISGAKNVIVHFYNSTSVLQRKVVFCKDCDQITKIAVDAAALIKKLGDQKRAEGMNLRYEYSPESFSGTETDYAVEICERVLDRLGATRDDKVIINLPNTVELLPPNNYADQIEYFCAHLKDRERAVISIHPHNDRGTGIAASEMGLLAGAERIEGTLFGNGERTGNADVLVLALNMFTQGIETNLDFSSLPKIKAMYEQLTDMVVHERHPYAGELVFTAFSGSHQDAINKGMHFMKDNRSDFWEVPYLPIDPKDVGREYEPIIRINSQSGKGGAAFVMEAEYGYILPKNMHPEFGAIVKSECDRLGREISKEEVFGLFEKHYINISAPYGLNNSKISYRDEGGKETVVFEGVIKNGGEKRIYGEGNGPIDAFFKAMSVYNIKTREFASYYEHADSVGSSANAIAYIELKDGEGKSVFGVGKDPNINMASIKGVLSAINRAK